MGTGIGEEAIVVPEARREGGLLEATVVMDEGL
jgi:hypothetical protein